MTRMVAVAGLLVLASGAQADRFTDWAEAAVAKKTTPAWQRAWATKALAGKLTPVKHWVFVTNYGMWDRHPFKGDYYHIASNRLPKGTVVFMDGTLKVVTNRGASSNDYWARHPREKEERQPAEFWVDRWTRRARHDNANQRIWVIGRSPWPH